MAKYRKKPIVVDAIIFNGENYEECQSFIGLNNIENTLSYPNIITSEGIMKVNVGDYIIKEPFDKKRNAYPCKPDIFKKTYEKIGELEESEVNEDNPEVDPTFKTAALAIAVGMQMYAEHHNELQGNKAISVEDIKSTPTYKHFFTR